MSLIDRTRVALAYVFYGLGHCVSKVMDYWPFEFMHPYRLYSWLMNVSDTLQGHRSGPWQSADTPMSETPPKSN
jgi:hypothetical protein